MRRFGVRTAVASLLIAFACAPTAPPQSPAELVWNGAGFFDHPFPENTRLDAAGRISYNDIPIPGDRRGVAEWLAVMEESFSGYSTVGAIYLRFADAPKEAQLPLPISTTTPDARLQLVQIDPDRPGFGERIPVQSSWRPYGNRSLPPGTLAVLPVPGFVLRPDTTYALLVYDGFAGWRMAPSSGFAARLTRGDAAGIDALIAAGNLPPSPVAGAIFTTQDPVAGLHAVAADIDSMAQPVTVRDWWYAGTSGNCRIVELRLDIPNYQHGEKPYTRTGGDWRFAADGTPVQAGTDTTRALLAVPDAVMPADGWPLMLYAHGTGGGAGSFLSTGRALCSDGIASLGFEQPLHGTRFPDGAKGDETILTFNIFNIRAIRDNIRQGAADLVALSYWLRNLDVAATAFPLGERFRMDKAHFMMMGHSQGASTGVPYLAVRGRHHHGAVLSGASGNLMLALLEKVAPLNIPLLFEFVIGAYGQYDLYHPLLTLFQTFAEPADALTYARYIQTEPYPGLTTDWHPIHLFVSEGIHDLYTPPELLEALVTPMALTWSVPKLREIPAFALLERAPKPRPITANYEAAGSTVTSVLVQYDSGHFALFDTADGRNEYRTFLRDLADDTPPVLDRR